MDFLRSINIRSKIIAAMLAAAALTGLTQAWLGNESVEESFSTSLDRRLSSIAHLTGARVETHLKHASDVILSLGTNPTIVFAFSRLSNSMKSLSPRAFGEERKAALRDYYADDFAPDLLDRIGTSAVVDALVPASPISGILQYNYIAKNPFPTGTRAELLKADDGSAYSDVHARFHPALKAIRHDFGLDDLLLIDAEGLVVYSVLKEADFMSDLSYGPFSDSGLAKAFEAARAERTSRPVIVQDFSFYTPSLGKPSFFMATPVFSGSSFLGVVAIQLSAEELNRVVSNGGDRRTIGLGDAGDIFIVANDGTLRSSARGFEEDKEGFLQALTRGRTDSETVGKIGAFNSPIGLASALNRLPEEDDQGEETYSTITGFYGEQVRSAAVPVRFPGLDWSVVAELPIAEAVRPVVAFERVVMIALAVTVTLTTIGATILASVMVRPLQRLAGRLQTAAEGDLDTPLSLPQQDAIGDVSRAAQSLVDGARERLGSAERERVGVQDLVSRFLPDGIARLVTSRPRDGDTDFDDLVEVVPRATFVLGRLAGFQSLFETLPPEEAVHALDTLVEAIDVAAERNGVEKIRTVSGTYFAAAGLSTPHLDHRGRALAFAGEMRQITRRFASERNFEADIGVGLASGAAISGVIGRHKLSYGVWGQPVTEVEMLCQQAAGGQILVAAEFAEAMSDVARFDPASNGRGFVVVSTSPTGTSADPTGENVIPGAEV